MRKSTGFSRLGKTCMKGAAFMVGMFMIQALCFLLPWEARTEGGKANGQKQAHADSAYRGNMDETGRRLSDGAQSRDFRLKIATKAEQGGSIDA
jgi:hypothetical protein